MVLGGNPTIQPGYYDEPPRLRDKTRNSHNVDILPQHADSRMGCGSQALELGYRVSERRVDLDSECPRPHLLSLVTRPGGAQVSQLESWGNNTQRLCQTYYSSLERTITHLIRNFKLGPRK